MPTGSTLDHALTYVRRGWAVLPLWGVVDGRCECAGRIEACDPDDPTKMGKHPRVLGGYKAGTTDEAKLLEWFTIWPHSNVGVSTHDGLAVVDTDPRNGGLLTRAVLGDEHTFPRAPMVATPSGGTHEYFLGTVDSRTDALGPGVDVKARKGYVVAPPSLGGSGRYRWVEWAATPPALPTWLTPVAKPKTEPNLRLVGGTYEPRYALGALRSEVDQASARRDGQRRRQELYSAGLKVSRFVIAGVLEYADVLAVLTAAGVESGLGEPVAESHVRNGLDQGIRNGAA
jgi:hypothetical protein